jgi:hypothetical protein
METNADQQRFDSEDYSVDTLVRAMRGDSSQISPPLAVALLQAKLGEDSVDALTTLVMDETVEIRGRYAATRALGAYPTSRAVLVRLSSSGERLIADAAAAVLRTLPDLS